MFRIICVTNRRMCADLPDRAYKLNKNGIEVILREKDLSEREYDSLAAGIIKVCPDVTLHTYTETAIRRGIKKIHLPFQMMNEDIANRFGMTGVSVHSADEAVAAQNMGASYVIAGHIFTTDCKKGLEARGTAFLSEVKRSVNIPVYAIGGISPYNISLIRDTGADGACIMSGFMKCSDIDKYTTLLREV